MLTLGQYFNLSQPEKETLAQQQKEIYLQAFPERIWPLEEKVLSVLPNLLQIPFPKPERL